jgi:acyl-coenzyme A synthetase/AMP-(fatty) acid ligase
MNESNRQVRPGEEGELYVAGPSVTSGYCNLPERNASSFFRDADGVRWYKTGDIVREDAHGDYVYVGRRDRMIKRRGYRVELGEIEAALHRHDSITEAAVVALPDPADDLCVTAFISCDDREPPSIIALKRFCMENLPVYMIPDRFSVQRSLPKTSTQKIDYQRLKELV